MKEQVELTNVKCLRLEMLHGHYTHVCGVSQVIGINKETKCVLNKENISGHS